MVLRTTGEWERAVVVGRSVLATPESSPHARAVASGVLGSLHVLRGQARPAGSLLRASAALARRIVLAAMELDSAWSLAMLDDLACAYASGMARCRALLDRWEQTEERHYVVAALRWAATFCAEHDGADEARACVAALARIATATGQADALAALAHALAETALLDGDAVGAAAQFDHALALLRERPLPFERAHSARRAGLALLRAGQRDAGLDRLVTAYRTARHLGARPLALRVAQDLAAEGEPVERRLSRHAGRQLRYGGLSRRELEVLRLVAMGHTSREIGAALFLSPRTVEMHLDHVRTKLGCRTRAEAARKATALGLLE
jgi:DNA-binding CsgD family transcriptional regulator